MLNEIGTLFFIIIFKFFGLSLQGDFEATSPSHIY